jgi:hypothetical protein
VEDHFANQAKRTNDKSYRCNDEGPVSAGASRKVEAIIAADFHVPFHCEKSLKEFIFACKEKDLIILDGDFQDFYGISKFDAAPTRADDLEYELTCGRAILSKIREVAGDKARIVYLLGNHEARLEKFLSRGKNKALFHLSCLSLKNLLSMDKYGIELFKDKYHINDFTIATHGTKMGLYPAKGEGLSYCCNGFSGHAHKRDQFYRSILNGKIEWYSLPCMCNPELLDYASAFRHTWNKGFVTFSYTEEDIGDVVYHEVT